MPSPETFITASVYGRDLLLPADHMLPAILANCPEFGEPVRVIDVLTGAPELCQRAAKLSLLALRHKSWI